MTQIFVLLSSFAAFLFGLFLTDRGKKQDTVEKFKSQDELLAHQQQENNAVVKAEQAKIAQLNTNHQKPDTGNAETYWNTPKN